MGERRDKEESERGEKTRALSQLKRAEDTMISSLKSLVGY